MKKLFYLLLLVCCLCLVGCSKASPEIPGQGSTGDNSGIVVETSRKIYYTVNINIETENVNKSVSYFSNQVNSLNGYISNSNIISEGSSNVTYRVPTENLQAFLDIIDNNNLGDVKNKAISTNDITSSYNKIAARLEILNASRTSYLNLLEKADSLYDIIELQNKIENLDSEILQLTMELDSYDNLLEYSTVKINFYQEESRSFIAGYLDYIVGFFKVLLYIFLYTLPFGFITGVIIFTIFFTKRKRRG